MFQFGLCALERGKSREECYLTDSESKKVGGRPENSYSPNLWSQEAGIEIDPFLFISEKYKSKNHNLNSALIFQIKHFLYYAAQYNVIDR